MSFEREKIAYNVGLRIRDFRSRRGLSQEALALNSGIHPAYLGKVERGEKCPTIDTLYKICSGLKISMSELLDFSIDVKPTSEEAMHRIAAVLSQTDETTAVKIADIVENIAEIYNTKPQN